MSEHFLRQAELDAFHLPGYLVATSYCRSKMARGGVCILTCEHITFTEVDVSVLKYNLYSTIIVYVNRPPNNKINEFQQFLSSLGSCIEYLSNVNCTIVITGDFNVDLSDKKSRPAKLLTDLMLSFGLRSTITSFTREFKGSTSIINNIFTDIPQHLTTTSVLITAISDHHAQLCELVDILPNPNKIGRAHV